MTLLYIYLGVGFVYAIYIWLFAGDPWYYIPINMIGGPIIVIGQTIGALRRRKYEIKDIFEGKKAVIFDLDGTIIDSQPFRNQAVENVLESIDAEWVFRTYPHGLNALEQWTHILKEEEELETELTPRELADRTKSEYLKLHTEVSVIEGFWELAYYLKEEKKFKLGLATNSDREVTNEILKRMEADGVFDFSVSGDELKRRKPHPEMYKKVAKGLGVRPGDVVVFEDTIVGATAAVKAGMETIVIWDGEDEDPEDFPKEIKFFLSDFDGVSKAIEKSTWEELEEMAKEMETEEGEEVSETVAEVTA